MSYVVAWHWRCCIMVACAQRERTHTEIAADLGCHPTTVGKMTEKAGWWAVRKARYGCLFRPFPPSTTATPDMGDVDSFEQW